MRTLYILIAILMILFLVGQIRVGGQLEYSACGFAAWVRVGAFQFQVLPWKRAEKNRSRKRKKAGKASAKGAEKPSVMRRMGGALDYGMTLLPIALEAAGCFWRRLRVDTLYLELKVSASDPGDAALRYGQASAALGALWIPLTRAFQVKDGNARVTVDFDAQETTLYGTAALSLKVGQVLWLGLYYGLKTLRGFLTVQKGQKAKQKRKAV